MIINVSRAKSFMSCPQFAYNWDELRLLPHREADPLIVGEAYHLGSEIVTKTGNVDQAVHDSEARIRERMEGQMILPEERADIERNIDFVKRATRMFADNYDKAEYRVLWPEVNGCVPLPETMHHCHFFHRLLYPDVPFEKCQQNYQFSGTSFTKTGLGRFPDPHQCWQPHYFKFRTDGLIEMYKKVWLLEQKTTSRAGSDFWTKFQLDQQIRGYCYGIWKTTGVLVSGVLINAIIKHSKQVTINGSKKYQLDPTNVGFEREPVLVTERDMLDFEHDIIEIATQYETSFRNPSKLYRNTQSCFAYNRKCNYFDRCCRHNEDREGEFRTRDADYVENQYYEILGIPCPVKETQNGQNNETFETEVG